MQFEHTHTWISDLGIGYHVGVDGLSLVLVRPDRLRRPLRGSPSASGRGGRASAPTSASSLLLEAALMLLFVARDLVLFYVGFEAMLMPLAFLIGLWGGPGGSPPRCGS